MMPPQPSSTLVNIAEHAELRLVRLLAENSPKPDLLSPSFELDCENRIANADAPGLIRAIIHDNGAMYSLFSMDPIEECVSAFSILAALLGRCVSEEEAILATEMADAVGSDESFDLEKRIALLCALYNLRSDGGEKCRLLSRIVRMCSLSYPSLLVRGQGPLGDILEPKSVVEMLNGWNVSVHHRRLLFRALADAMKTSKESDADVQRQRFLLMDVETYTDPSEFDDDALLAAQEASVGAIRDPVTLFSEQRGMLTFPTIAALQQNPATEPLFSLLKIFQMGKLQDYQSFMSNRSNARAILSQYSLSPDECIRNMRLLSLCSLASEHQQIPYSSIASTLQIPVSEVETWIIAAVSHDLLLAKMDQLQQVVMVEQCVVRIFGFQQWKALQIRLNDWKSNVKNVIDGLKQCQELQTISS